jgi:hypothetical protein
MAEEQTNITPELTDSEKAGKALSDFQASQIIDEAAKDKGFVSEPMPWNKADEVEGQTTGDKPEEDKPKVELNPDGTPKAVDKPTQEIDTAKQEVQTEQIPEEEFVALLNNAISDPEISFKSLEDIKALVSENKKLKGETEFHTLSQEERARIEVGREYGDFGLFDRVMAIDTTKLSHKDALKHVYFLDNIGKNTQLLERLFDKEYRKTYEDDLEDEDLTKMLLENNGQEAIEKLIDLQNELKDKGKLSGSAKPDTSAEDKKKEDAQWFAAVDKVISKNDRVSYTLDEGLVLNIVMDAKDKEKIQAAMDNPVAFLKSMIADENGVYDHEAIFEFVLRNFYYQNALEEARIAGAAFHEEKLLKTKKHTTIESNKAGDTGTETKLGNQLAGSFRQMISNNF